MKVLHDRGLVHGDLTPQNILMFGNTPKIADFGGVTFPGAEVRTVNQAWESPESSLYDEHSPAMDVWAFGLTLYSWLTGEDPWDFDTKVHELLPRLSNYR
jgi:serine/threonine protein kinase